MVLPFNATSVTADGEAIDWMHSKTDAKGLWVCNYDMAEDNSDNAQLFAQYMGEELAANVPYFVAPNDGTQGADMRDKTFVFSGTNVTVKPNPSAITSGPHHMIVGEFAQKDIDNAFFLNAAGSHFVKADQGTVNAFEVYANNVTSTNANKLQIVLDEGEAPTSLRGDVNNDGIINLTDVITLIDYLLSDDQSLINPQSADCKIDGIINLEDITALIDYMLNETW